MKKIVISIFLTAIIFTGIGVYAGTLIYADQVEYAPNVTVKDKIDDLYTIASTYKNLSVPTSIQSSDLLLNKKAYNSDGTLITGSIATYNGATNVTPSTSSQTLSTSGKYVNSDITVSAIPVTTAHISFTSTSSAQTFDLGFRPKYISCAAIPSGSGFYGLIIYNYDYSTSYALRLISNASTSSVSDTSLTANVRTSLSTFYTISDSGFSWNVVSSSWLGKTVYCSAHN